MYFLARTGEGLTTSRRYVAPRGIERHDSVLRAEGSDSGNTNSLLSGTLSWRLDVKEDRGTALVSGAQGKGG